MKGNASRRLRWQLWDYYVPNVFHILLGQADYRTRKAAGKNYGFGAQVTRQDAVGDGGNADSRRHTSKLEVAPGYQRKAGILRDQWQVWINYTSHCRRKPIPPSTRMGPRSFLHLSSTRTQRGSRRRSCPDGTMELRKRAGHEPILRRRGLLSPPDANDAALNKYGMPSYVQVNLEYRRHFSGILKGSICRRWSCTNSTRGELFGKEATVSTRRI